MKIYIRCFGALRDFTSHSSSGLEISYSQTEPIVVAKLKEIIIETLLKSSKQSTLDIRNLVLRSVLAHETQILKDNDFIHSEMKLSILPPVCGG